MHSNAQWIWPKNLGSVNTYARFEDRVVCNENSAVAAHISVSGEYVLEINGQVAGFGQFGDWPEYKTFNIHDITSLCVAGENSSRLLAWQPGLDCSVSVAGPGRACFWLEQDGKILLSSGTDTPCAPDDRYAAVWDGQSKPIPSLCVMRGRWLRWSASGMNPSKPMLRPSWMVVRPFMLN